MSGKYDCLTECNGACCRLLSYPAGLDEKFWKARGFRIIDGYALGEKPCTKLLGNRCTIYLNRPTTCEIFAVGGKLCQAARKFYGLEVRE